MAKKRSLHICHLKTLLPLSLLLAKLYDNSSSNCNYMPVFVLLNYMDKIMAESSVLRQKAVLFKARQRTDVVLAGLVIEEFCWLVFKRLYDFRYFYCESIRDFRNTGLTAWLFNNPLTRPVDIFNKRSQSKAFLSQWKQSASLRSQFVWISPGSKEGYFTIPVRAPHRLFSLTW